MGRISLIILLLTTLALESLAQGGPSTFEFTENKGQWESKIKFKGELPAGEFYLHPNGFTVVQHNTDDLLRYFQRQHGAVEGNTGSTQANARTGKHKGDFQPQKPGNDGDGGGNSNLIIRSHAYQVQFLGASASPEIVPDKPLSTYSNYFIGNDPSKWASNVKIFQAVLYKNVYPNIDIRYYSENGQLKYDFIINPGGNVNNIVMRFEGADKLVIKNNELIIKTSVGDVRELYPYSYQFDQLKGKQETPCSYELADKNTVRFKVGNYSKTNTLIIDPSLIFSSFTGSKAGQYGFTATPGPDGSLFSGGIVFGNGFPTSPGAYQTSYQGGSANGGNDMGIFKFSPDGSQRVYATYLGGEGNDYPHSLISDPQGNLVIMGRTYSSRFPGTLVGPGGGADICVTKLNAAGTGIIGSLRIGGSSSDGVNISDLQEGGSINLTSTLRFYGDDSRSEVGMDASGYIYVAAQSRSGDFKTIGPVFQPTSGGGQDGVVMKIDPNCTGVIWSSFLGGSGDDGAFVIAIDPANNDIYVGGATTSGNFPGNKTGVYQAGGQGGTDGFVAQIANDGSSIIHSTYMGTGNFDAVYGIKFDKLSIPYIMGITEGTWPIVNAAYNGGKSCQFIAKLKPDLSGFTYSTTFGTGAGKPNISPVAFLVDRCENVYISGWGGWISTSGRDPFNMSGVAGMPVTPDALKSNTDNHDFYFIVIKKDAASLLYGSFFGQSGGEGDHVDGGTSRYDAQGVIYQAICANCFGNSVGAISVPFPITPGVWGPTNGTGTSNCNLAAAKIAFNFAGVAAGPQSYFNNVVDTLGCVPFTVVLKDTILNAKSYIWTFNDGTPDETTNNTEVTHTFSAIGNYRVRLIGIDSTTCNIRDTAYVTIHVRDDKADLAFLSMKLPPCQSLLYQFDNTTTFPPTKPFKASSFTWDFGDGTRVTPGPITIQHSFASAGTYKTKLILNDTSYCNSPDSVTKELRVSPLVDARFETPPSGCAPYTAIFNNTSLAGQQFFWDFGDGTTSTDVNPVHVYNNIGTYHVTLVAVDSSTCNITDSTSVDIGVHPLPTADFSFAPVPPQTNRPTVFTNLSTGGARYVWLFGDGDSTIKTTMDTVGHQYNETATFNACLITFNEFECSDTACHAVDAVIDPLLDVPNAFTPGRFGKNSYISVVGFGIAKMTWRIYNRWGTMVFETNNRKIGWDGSYKGQPQPMDVYAYTLDVEFSDGRKLRKTGDITLIR